MPTDIQPGAVDSPTAPEVWAAIIRKHGDYHELADPARTVCGRSTASPTSVLLTVEEAMERGMRPCRRCHLGGR